MPPSGKEAFLIRTVLLDEEVVMLLELHVLGVRV
jgi:hypothetical protein